MVETELKIDHTTFMVLSKEVGSFWSGNTIATVSIKSFKSDQAVSGIFLVPNMSRVAQGFT